MKSRPTALAKAARILFEEQQGKLSAETLKQVNEHLQQRRVKGREREPKKT